LSTLSADARWLRLGNDFYLGNVEACEDSVLIGMAFAWRDLEESEANKIPPDPAPSNPDFQPRTWRVNVFRERGGQLDPIATGLVSITNQPTLLTGLPLANSPSSQNRTPSATYTYGSTEISWPAGSNITLGDIIVVVAEGNDDNTFGEVEITPSDGVQVESCPAISNQAVHIVQPGDTLFSLARRYGVNISDLVNANNILNPNQIYIGQKLVISRASTPGTPAERVHLVQAGENLFRIALRYGTSVSAIATANNISNPRLIYIGQRLTIPSAS